MTSISPKLPRSPEGFINTPEGLAEVCEYLRSAKIFGFDTEFIREASYRPLLCLVQVATDERAELIDPLAIRDFNPFWDLLADPTVEKICYGAGQDLEIAWQIGRQMPQNVFDCQIGAGLVGIGYQEAYWRLVEIVAGVRLDKGATFSDWSRRPLSGSQIKYALDDVLYLPEIYRTLRSRMEALGRLDWMREACREACEKAATDQDPQMIFASIKGASRLGSRQLAVLRELTLLREELACEQDVPARTMLRDEVLTELASAGPETMAQLGRIKSLPPAKADRHGERIIETIKRGKALPHDQRPYLPPPMEDTTETKRLSEIMYASSQVICLGQSVSPKLLTNQAEIQGLARLVTQGLDPSEHALMNGWARECLGAPLLDLVHGKTGVALNVTHGQMHAEFEETE